MGFFDKKRLLDTVEGTVTGAVTKVSEAVQGVDVKGAICSVKETAVSVTERTTEVTNAVQGVDIRGAISSVKQTAVSVTEHTTEATNIAYTATKAKVVSTYEFVSEEIRSLEYTELLRVEYYQQRCTHYTNLSSKKALEHFRATFEVDKSTMEMVDDVRSRLPIPAKTVNDIFDQCKREAMRRAIAAFALSDIMKDIDNRSEAKYANLSESYNEFNSHSEYAMKVDPNFVAMSNMRGKAKENWTQLENGYNKDQPLDPISADIEHVIAKKELYDDMLLRIGTTNDEFCSLINSYENLVFAEGSLNSGKNDKSYCEFKSYLENRGSPHPDDSNLVDIEYIQKDGLVKTVTVNLQDIEDAYDRADKKRNEHRISAATEVGMTVIKTGAAMAAQQVVGLIVLETIDIFIDEIRSFTINGQLINKDGWLQNSKDATARVQQRLAERFEERQIWARAKSLGIEAGIAGALSVIPQILISLLLKMPSFLLALVRECTLSLVRCVRVLTSSDVDKFESIKVILAGATAAIVSVYVGRVINNAIAGVPLLNRFNAQITDVLTGLMVTAVPLAAIYTFEQNKHKLNFITSLVSAPSEQTV